MAFDHVLEEPQYVLVTDTALEQREKDTMVHAIEELFDVRTPEVTMLVTTEEELSPIEGTVEALAFTARPDIMDEAPIVEENEFVVEKSMDKTITEGSDGDHPALIVRDGEGSIGAVAIRFMDEIIVQQFDVLFERVAETLKFRCSTLPLRKYSPTLPEFFD